MQAQSSSILKLVNGFSIIAVVVGLLGSVACPLLADETTASKLPDTFFAGTVTQLTKETITVGRVVRGKTESRTFQLSAETKTEGRLAAKVRVTVRFVSDDDGDAATLIVVRGSVPKTVKTKKK